MQHVIYVETIVICEELFLLAIIIRVCIIMNDNFAFSEIN